MTTKTLSLGLSITEFQTKFNDASRKNNLQSLIHEIQTSMNPEGVTLFTGTIGTQSFVMGTCRQDLIVALRLFMTPTQNRKRLFLLIKQVIQAVGGAYDVLTALSLSEESRFELLDASIELENFSYQIGMIDGELVFMVAPSDLLPLPW